MSNTAYPLTWPDHWVRTKHPSDSKFKTTLAGALKNVQKSIEMFAKDSGKKVSNVLISSNVTLGTQNPKDPGVAIYFEWDDISTCIAVDRYKKVEANLQAIHHCIEAERTKLRHGGLNLVRAAFRGYAALPPPGATNDRSWWDVLECKSGAPLATVEKQYKRLRADHHPDRGGDPKRFDEIQKAIKEARRHANT